MRPGSHCRRADDGDPPAREAVRIGDNGGRRCDARARAASRAGCIAGGCGRRRLVRCPCRGVSTGDGGRARGAAGSTGDRRIAGPNTGRRRTRSAPIGVLSLVDLGISLIRQALALRRFEVLDEVGHDKSVGPSLVAEPTTVVQR